MPRTIALLPDFYVIGAQKAGTTALCSLLAQHPAIAFSQPKEPFILSRDEAWLHPHFFARFPDAYREWDWNGNREHILAQYADCFADAAPGQLCGEGSTSYLASHHAPERLAALRPDAKIIVMLRDPAERAYSAWRHYVKSGESCLNFAAHLEYEGGLTLYMGEYAAHLKRWLTYFSGAQILVLQSDALRLQRGEALAATLDFLSLPPFDEPPVNEDGNEALRPRSLALQLHLNRLRQKYASQSPFSPYRRTGQGMTQVGLECLSAWNLTDRPGLPMQPEIRSMLDAYYARANHDLPEILQQVRYVSMDMG